MALSRANVTLGGPCARLGRVPRRLEDSLADGGSAVLAPCLATSTLLASLLTPILVMYLAMIL